MWTLPNVRFSPVNFRCGENQNGYLEQVEVPADIFVGVYIDRIPFLSHRFFDAKLAGSRRPLQIEKRFCKGKIEIQVYLQVNRK